MAKRKHNKALSIVRKFFPKVTGVVDATEPVTIEVTKQDERAAARKDHAVCALAVACKRSEHMDGVIVSIGRAYLIKGKRATRYFMSQSAAREVVSFDRGSAFAPGAYTLIAPHKGNRLGDRQRPKRGPQKAASKRRKYHFTEGIRTVLGG